MARQSQFARAAIRGSLLQVGITALHIVAKNLTDPLRIFEVLDCLLNVVRQVTARSAQVLYLGNGAVDAGLKDAVQRGMRILIGRNRTHLGTN